MQREISFSSLFGLKGLKVERRFTLYTSSPFIAKRLSQKKLSLLKIGVLFVGPNLVITQFDFLSSDS